MARQKTPERPRAHSDKGISTCFVSTRTGTIVFVAYFTERQRCDTPMLLQTHHPSSRLPFQLPWSWTRRRIREARSGRAQDAGRDTSAWLMASLQQTGRPYKGVSGRWRRARCVLREEGAFCVAAKKTRLATGRISQQAGVPCCHREGVFDDATLRLHSLGRRGKRPGCCWIRVSHCSTRSLS